MPMLESLVKEFEEDFEEGRKRAQFEVALELLKDNIPLEKIAQHTKLSLPEIKDLAFPLSTTNDTPLAIFSDIPDSQRLDGFRRVVFLSKGVGSIGLRRLPPVRSLIVCSPKHPNCNLAGPFRSPSQQKRTCLRFSFFRIHASHNHLSFP